MPLGSVFPLWCYRSHFGSWTATLLCVTTESRKTLLVVDDDPIILRFVARILEEQNYEVLVANSGVDAMRIAAGHAGDIALLLSDFEMPGMSGIDLAVKLTELRPQIKVLRMSGYTGGMLVLNEGWHFLAKPFIESQLRALITTLLFPANSRFKS